MFGVTDPSPYGYKARPLIDFYEYPYKDPNILTNSLRSKSQAGGKPFDKQCGDIGRYATFAVSLQPGSWSVTYGFSIGNNICLDKGKFSRSMAKPTWKNDTDIASTCMSAPSAVGLKLRLRLLADPSQDGISGGFKPLPFEPGTGPDIKDTAPYDKWLFKYYAATAGQQAAPLPKGILPPYQDFTSEVSILSPELTGMWYNPDVDGPYDPPTNFVNFIFKIYCPLKADSLSQKDRNMTFVMDAVYDDIRTANQQGTWWRAPLVKGNELTDGVCSKILTT